MSSARKQLEADHPQYHSRYLAFCHDTQTEPEDWESHSEFRHYLFHSFIHYKDARGIDTKERKVIDSDDFTAYLWEQAEKHKWAELLQKKSI